MPRPLLHRVFDHWRDGTLLAALRNRFVTRGAGSRARWDGVDTAEQAASALAAFARKHAGPGDGWALIVGDRGPLHECLEKALRRASIRFRAVLVKDLHQLSTTDGRPSVILNACPSARSTMEAARFVTRHPELASVPFEYVGGLERERGLFRDFDEYGNTFFVSPVLLDRPSPYAIYEESLHHFEQKCGLRDYLDLYQLLKSAIDRTVPGDVAEFGSFRGHSGWLIARTLQALGSEKNVFLFDTFESFPHESAGVDRFWSGTHDVQFDEVRAKFADLHNVRFVKGDFTQTLRGSGLGKVALAYVDCDSYRGTRYLIDALWEPHLDRGGVLVCEDYGHPALLGNRAAVHEYFDGRTDAIRFFSQFSGFYIAIKT